MECENTSLDTPRRSRGDHECGGGGTASDTTSGTNCDITLQQNEASVEESGAAVSPNPDRAEEEREPQHPSEDARNNEAALRDCDNSEFKWTRNQQLKLSSKVCKCSGVTVGEAIFMVVSLGFQHNLTWEAQVDILRMVSTITGSTSIPGSKTGLLNYIDKLQHAMKFEIFCPDCEVYIGEKKPPRSSAEVPHKRKSGGDKTEASSTEKEIFICRSCNNSVDSSKPSNFFMSVSIEEQLKTIMLDEKFAEDIVTHRFKREQVDDVLSDIYDGAQYKKHCGPNGILSHPFNFSWTFFTDGISPGKSTGKTMWPIYLNLNEAPKSKRHKYVLLGCLYVGTTEPNPWVIFQPFVREINKLATVGFSWKYKGKPVQSRIIPLLAITDSAARFRLLNMQSFLAFFGCTFCYQEQVVTAPRKRRYDTFSAAAPMRTAESTKQDCLDAYYSDSQNGVVRGVKGPSVLMELKYFDLIWGFVVDPMHALLLGLIKMHMEFLFESLRDKFWVNKRLGVEERRRLIDERLLKITPPTGITRNTRPIAMYKLWKASEWRSWLLFYCIPCLQGLLKPRHLVHLAQLSKATCLLLQKSVTTADIAESKYLFDQYARNFQKYFDVKHTIYNVHLLRHIPTCAENFGPLWTHDAFPYEGQNRHVLQLLTGPNNVLYQVNRRFLVYTSLPRLCHDLVTNDAVVDFCERSLNKSLQRCWRSGQCVLTGLLSDGISADAAKLLNEYVGMNINLTSDVCLYSTLRYNQMRFTTAEYVGKKRNDDSYVFLEGKRYAVRIKHIINIRNSTLLIGEKMKLQGPGVIQSDTVTVNHIKRIRKLGSLVCADVSSVICQGIIMKLGEDEFIARMPYGCYGD